MAVDRMLAIAPFCSLSAGQPFLKALVFRCHRMAGLRDRNDLARLKSSRFDIPKSYTRSFNAGIKFGSTMWKMTLQLPIRCTRAPSLWMPSSNTDEVFLGIFICT
jgi:hypothetical protein